MFMLSYLLDLSSSMKLGSWLTISKNQIIVYQDFTSLPNNSNNKDICKVPNAKASKHITSTIKCTISEKYITNKQITNKQLQTNEFLTET